MLLLTEVPIIVQIIDGLAPETGSLPATWLAKARKKGADYSAPLPFNVT
ncbi:hypothetical protein [Litoreibacter arenae]|uniref:Uncharacterized protein n=1 Tax=Litoreibacter arenae DSM 19593 TaxID=1123360 RepID=S9RJC8_9RHOB|nr:hypothetical protein [Litoreibacter arenae]EPX78215.1 hypothetical protein thalar_02444 [Litoreibacter arenae DSM 19593]